MICVYMDLSLGGSREGSGVVRVVGGMEGGRVLRQRLRFPFKGVLGWYDEKRIPKCDQGWRLG